MRTTLTSGADADQLELAARELRAAADELDAHAASLTAALRSVAWVGGVATHFNNDWRGAHRPRMASTSGAVRDAANALDRHAREQRSASAMEVSADVVVVGTWSQERAPVGDLADDLEHALKALGIGRDQLESFAELADLLENDRHAGHLIEMLTDEGFVQFLKNADGFLDGAEIAVDIVQDFVDNPDLSLDDRIVHAVADSAIRFGISEGAEKAGEFLTQAVLTTVVPGLGGVFGFVAGKAVGMMIDEVMDRVIDVVDASTDVVDQLADAAVDLWRLAKEGFGLVLDIGGAVVEVVGDAAEFAGDLADAGVEFVGDLAGGALDFGGDVLSGAGDVAGTVGGWIGL